MISISLLLLITIMIITNAEPSEDKVSSVPGYPSSFQNRVFAGYLKTESDLRKLHYIFIEGNQGVNNSAPVVLWLNGGPGCTSNIGFVQ